MGLARHGGWQPHVTRVVQGPSGCGPQAGQAWPHLCSLLAPIQMGLSHSPSALASGKPSGIQAPHRSWVLLTPLPTTFLGCCTLPNAHRGKGRAAGRMGAGAAQGPPGLTLGMTDSRDLLAGMQSCRASAKQTLGSHQGEELKMHPRANPGSQRSPQGMPSALEGSPQATALSPLPLWPQGWSSWHLGARTQESAGLR